VSSKAYNKYVKLKEVRGRTYQKKLAIKLFPIEYNRINVAQDGIQFRTFYEERIESPVSTDA